MLKQLMTILLGLSIGSAACAATPISIRLINNSSDASNRQIQIFREDASIVPFPVPLIPFNIPLKDEQQPKLLE